jgi:uncharacterized membrane protein
MSDLIAVAYPDLSTAQDVMQKLAELRKEHTLELEDAAIVTRAIDGKVKLHQANLAGAGALGGALWGGLIGLIFLAPLLGAAIGAAAGAVTGHFTDIGVDDNFRKELGNHLPPGGAAVILLVRKITPDKVLAEVAPFGGYVLKTSLSTEAEGQLNEALRSRGAGG